MTYSQGLLGLKMMYLISENHKKSLLHRTVLVCHNLYCSFAIYAVLMHSMLLDCNMCCFIAVHATLIPFCCNLRCFVAAIWLLQNTRFPRHFWGGSQALSTFIDVWEATPVWSLFPVFEITLHSSHFRQQFRAPAVDCISFSFIPNRIP